MCALAYRRDLETVIRSKHWPAGLEADDIEVFWAGPGNSVVVVLRLPAAAACLLLQLVQQHAKRLTAEGIRCCKFGEHVGKCEAGPDMEAHVRSLYSDAVSRAEKAAATEQAKAYPEAEGEVDQAKHAAKLAEATGVDDSPIPTDILQALKNLNLKSEAAAIQAAAIWCTENEPSSLADIQGDKELIDDFLSALRLPKIPEKKFRATLDVEPKEQADAGTYASKYKTLELIGKGGFGKTYLVRDVRSDQRFAGKQISGLAKAEADEALREFQVMQAHPHEMLVEAREAFCETDANGEFTVRPSSASDGLTSAPDPLHPAPSGHNRDGVLRRRRPAGLPEESAVVR